MPRPPESGSAPGSARIGPRRERSTAHAVRLILLATLCFAGSDVLTKRLTDSVPSLEAAWLRYVSFTAILAVFLLGTGRIRSVRSRLPGWQVARGVALAASTLVYAAGLSYLPVTVAAATNFVSPILIGILAALFLRERLSSGWIVWSLFGLMGVLVVMRPGTEAFQGATILPVIAALCFAVGNVSTRHIGRLDGTLTTLAHTATVGLVLLSLPLPFFWVTPTGPDLARGFAVGIVSTAGHALVVRASQHAASSLLAPFFYLQLLGTTVLGYLVLGSVPDGWTLVGSAMIVVSGIASFGGAMRQDGAAPVRSPA